MSSLIFLLRFLQEWALIVEDREEEKRNGKELPSSSSSVLLNRLYIAPSWSYQLHTGAQQMHQPRPCKAYSLFHEHLLGLQSITWTLGQVSNCNKTCSFAWPSLKVGSHHGSKAHQHHKIRGTLVGRAGSRLPRGGWWIISCHHSPSYPEGCYLEEEIQRRMV